MFDLSGLLFIGTAIVVGFFVGKATYWIKLTAIVGYILAGVILGPVLGIITIPPTANRLIIDFTLSLVAFIIGVGFTKSFLKQMGMVVVSVTLIQSLLTFVIVLICVYLLTFDLPLAIVFGALGLATAPAGTVAALHECRATGTFARLTIGIVGLDDAVAVLIFVVGLAVVRTLLGGETTLFPIFETIGIEIGLAIALGVAIGIIMTYTMRLLREHEEMFIAAAGMIILCAGIADVIHASIILACMVAGVTFINLSPREGQMITTNIENLIPVIFVIFFVTAGLELQPQLLLHLGALGGIYVVSRIIGKYFGAFVGCKTSKTEPAVTKYLGLALLSQAGVAIGLAILVANELHGLPGGDEIGLIAVTVITATTVVFEIIGPLGVKFAVQRVQGEESACKEDKILSRLRKTADEVEVHDYEIDEGISVYDDNTSETLIYDRDNETDNN